MTLTLKQIDGRIMLLSGRFARLNSDVQLIAVSILEHAMKPNEAGEMIGDVSRFPKLCRALSPRERPVFGRWVANVGPIRMTMGKTAKDDRVSLYKEGHDKYVPWNLDLAKASKWSDDPFKTEKDEDELNTIATYIDSAERLLDRMARDTKEDAGKVEPEHIAKVQALRSALRDAFQAYINDEPAARPAKNERETPAEPNPIERYEEAARKTA